MYVILTQDVPQVGAKNSLVSVAEGYFMNYLSPRNLAEPASEGILESLKDTILSQKEASDQAAKSAEEHASVLKDASIIITDKASAKGTFFKAVAEAEVALAIMKQFKIEVDPSQIAMEHLKKVGEHTVDVLMGDKKVKLKVVLEASKEL